MEQYDIIIAGSGAAGLSLAYYLSCSPLLQSKKVLLLDKDPKVENDRTWGFWTKKATPLDDIVSFSFSEAEFISQDFSTLLPLSPYQYKVIEGARFYEHVKRKLSALPNFHFRTEEIKSMESGEEAAILTTNYSSYKASWIFNSCFLEKELAKAAQNHLFLRQHFKGWVIKTPEACFDSSRVRLFDFRTPQKGSMRFFYIIPQTPEQALIEYTLFSAELLQPPAYDEAIDQYIREILQIKDFEVVEQEWGVIPMTTFPFPARTGKRIINIGSVGGASKPSTGYTFLRIQQQCQSLVQQMEKEQELLPLPMGSTRFCLYDEMLLNIMDKKGDYSEEIFRQLFQNNPVQRILKFLDEETHLGEELLIMNSVPRKKFIKSFLNLKFGTPFY